MFYIVCNMKRIVELRNSIFITVAISVLSATSEVAQQVDKVIEEEITQKLSEDLLQSIERKFQVDLEKSVDQVLSKIKILLQNGTSHIQDRLSEMQSLMDVMRKNSGDEMVDMCLVKRQNETTALAEKALHQMVVCGYALIGHDPAKAVKSVVNLKGAIKEGIQPIREQQSEVYNLLKVCGHDHDTLKKVIKCVISKSPQLKSAMMAISGKLVDGVVDLSKQMAHGAMHEACLIEVINTVEDEAFGLIRKVKKCANNETDDGDFNDDLDKYLKEDNATVLELNRNEALPKAKKGDTMKDIIRRMLRDNKKQEFEERFKEKMKSLQQNLKVKHD